MKKRMIKRIADFMNELFGEKVFHYWLPYYVWDRLTYRSHTPPPLHIMFCVVDHFEPFHGGVDFQRAKQRVDAWTERYPKMADNHEDADGKPPLHTWFYPPHLDHCFLKDLVNLCRNGYGEIEMHLHHNHMDPFPDTSDTLRKKIQKCINDYSKFGIFCLPDGRKTFAFVHGDWSLDNSRGGAFCGVNDEIRILKETGCYADFTFPSLGKAQPVMVNRFYYAKDDPNQPKSYNWGKPVRVGGKKWGDLLMVQGIIGLRWKSRTRRFRPSVEISNIDNTSYPFPKRIDYWIKHAIKIKGKNDWLFIKLHTHGAVETAFDSLFGHLADQMYDYLENTYNDQHHYFLHYVTSREMVNIIKAAEAGMNGNPNTYRDFEIGKYQYLTEL